MKEVVGGYKIHLDKIIDKGNQATIYECTNTDSNTRCCVRVVSKRNQNYYQSNEDIYRKELEVLEQLKWIRHQNILAIYDYKNEENYIYEFCDLCDYSLRAQTECFTKKDFFNFIQQISSGYLELKKHNIFHRDLKPENILVKRQQWHKQYKIVDFGISKLINENDRLNTKMVGTQQYSSPEMLNSTNYSYESDIFSFGVILYEFTTGNLNLINDIKKQRQFFEMLKTQSFKDIVNSQIEQKIQESILNLLDKLIVYDPKKRMNWEELNQLVTTQLKEFQSFNLPIADNRERGGFSLHESRRTEFIVSYENQNHNNLANSQINFTNNQQQFQNYQSLDKDQFQKLIGKKNNQPLAEINQLQNFETNRTLQGNMQQNNKNQQFLIFNNGKKIQFNTLNGK